MRTYGPCECEGATSTRVVYCTAVSAYIDEDYHEHAQHWSRYPDASASQTIHGSASKWSLQAFVAKSKTALSRVVDKLSIASKRDGRKYCVEDDEDDGPYGRRPLTIYPEMHSGGMYGEHDWMMVHGGDSRLPCQCPPCREQQRMRHRKRTRAGRRKYRRSRFEGAAAMQISRNGGSGSNIDPYERITRHCYQAY